MAFKKFQKDALKGKPKKKGKADAKSKHIALMNKYNKAK